MKILFVLTSNSELGTTGKKTGFWLDEFTAPYYLLADGGADISLASPKGGMPPVDPASELPEALSPTTIRYENDQELKNKMAHTLILSTVKEADYDAIFYPGGHGLLWDLVDDKDSISLIENFYNNNKPVAFVCHSPAALMHVKTTDGSYLVKDKEVTGFSNTEENAVQLSEVVPFKLEDGLKNLGGLYSRGPDWAPYVRKDGLLITGQNPASSEEVAKVLLQTLEPKEYARTGNNIAVQVSDQLNH